MASLVGLLAGGVVSSAPPASARAKTVWLTSKTAAARALPKRFHNISSVSCTPDRAGASKVVGSTRRWQRFWCSGHTYDHLAFRLRFRKTGKCSNCWTITNLSGLSAARLRVKHVTATRSTPSSTSCPSDYYRNSSGHCVHRPSSDPTGATAQCWDGSYSYSEHASGTCSHHGGVKRWINHP